MSLLSAVINRGLRSAQLAATAVAVGYLYYVTDEYVLERSNGTIWQTYSEQGGFYNAGNSGTALTLDWLNGRKQRFVMTGNCTLTLSNPVDGAKILLKISSGAGSFTLAWPAAVLWSGGTAPVITAVASKTDMIVLIYEAATAKYFGSFQQNYNI